MSKNRDFSKLGNYITADSSGNITLVGSITGGAASFSTGAYSGDITINKSTPAYILKGGGVDAKVIAASSRVYLTDDATATKGFYVDLSTGALNLMGNAITSGGAASFTTGAFSSSVYSGYASTNTVWTGSTTGANFVAGYWALRTAANNSFNLDVYNSASPFAALTVLQTGTVLVSGGSGNTLSAGSLDVAKDIGIAATYGIVSGASRVLSFQDTYSVKVNGTLGVTGAASFSTGTFSSTLNANGGTFQLAAWNALTYSGSTLYVGGSTAAQWNSINFYTSATVALSITSSQQSVFTSGAINSMIIRSTDPNQNYVSYNYNTTTTAGFVGTQYGLSTQVNSGGFAVRGETNLQLCISSTPAVSISAGGGAGPNFNYGSWATLATSPSGTYQQSIYGGMNLMWRNAEDAYINSNHYYNNSSTNTALYTSVSGMGRLSIAGGDLIWYAYNGTVTAGSAYTISEIFHIYKNSDVEAKGQIISTSTYVKGTTSSSTAGIGAYMEFFDVTNQRGWLSQQSVAYNYRLYHYNSGWAAMCEVSSGTGAYTALSDARYKTNIVDAPSALDLIDRIQVRSYDWKVDGKHEPYGVVAQELVDVLPTYVTRPTDDNDVWQVGKAEMVPFLIKVIQELKAEVNSLKQQLGNG